MLCSVTSTFPKWPSNWKNRIAENFGKIFNLANWPTIAKLKTREYYFTLSLYAEVLAVAKLNTRQ